MVPALYQRQRSIRKKTKMSTKMILAMRTLQYEELPRTDHWTLEDWRVRGDLIEVYKINRGFLPVSFDTVFQFFHDSNTRICRKLHKRRVHTDLRQHFFTVFGIPWMNSLFLQFLWTVSTENCKKLHTDGSFPRLFKPTWPLGPSQISGKALTGKILWATVVCSSIMYSARIHISGT